MPDDGPRRLTNSSEETELARLLSADAVFSIPYFQRSYKWGLDKLRQLQEDLLSVVDTGDSHFLGAVIVYGRQANPADPSVYEVIDGQQRTTTVFLFICAIVRCLCQCARRLGRDEDAEQNRLYGEAQGLLQRYLAIGRETNLLSNSKLHCCKEDRAQLNRVFEDVLSDRAFADRLTGFRYNPLPASGQANGRLWSNYLASRRFLDRQVDSEGVERLRDIYKALLESMSVVQIVVRNPTDGPKIFDSLNSRQEPMTIGDLVRNEIFSRFASSRPDDIEAIDRRSWQPFYSKFRDDETNLFDAYFFPYGLVQDPNVRKSEVYESLRSQWRSIDDPEAIVAELSQYQDAFLDVCRGTNGQNHPEAVHQAFARLHRAKAPSSTYPFLMQLSNAATDGRVSAESAIAVLQLVESFLVRRALCGHEPTGLHAVFKRLWADCDGSPNAGNVEQVIRGHRTVAWPSAEDVINAIANRPLYGSSITQYVLVEWNRYVGGDQPAEQPWVEHVLPEQPADEWWNVFGRDQHGRMKDLLANLLPLSSAMNRELGNKAYSIKRPIYRDDSGFKAARRFADEHEEWTPAKLEERSQMLADWAVERWPV